MENGDYFLQRLQDSLDAQTFQDFEVIYTRDGLMAHNTNSAIKKAKGDIVKVLYMDDFLWSKDALQEVHNAFTNHIGWYASGCVHTDDGIAFSAPHVPSYNEQIHTGNNTIGSPSVVAFENDDPLLFDENLSWLLDCDLYARLHKRYGPPMLNPALHVAIGIGPHQTTYKLTDEQKKNEHGYLARKYE